MAIEDVAVIGVAVETTGIERGKKSLEDLAKSGRQTEQAISGLEVQSKRTTDGISSLAVAARAAAASFGAAEIVRLTDQYTKYTAQLKLATDSTNAYKRSLDQVRSIATRAQQELSGVGTLFARIATGTKELGLSQQRVAAITETVALSLKVSGAAASESASAMLQLSQAFASGALRGEEFNAVNEAAPRLMKALADGLGVPIGALREMAAQGKLTSEVLANALPKALGDLRNEAKSVETIGGAFTVLKNNVLEFIGTQAQASGVIKVITTGINALADNLNVLAGAAAGFAAAKLAQVFIGAGAAALKGVAGSVSFAQALNAQRVASVAAAQASLQTTSAQVAQTAATNALAAAERQRAASITALTVLGRQQAASAAQATTAIAAQTAAQVGLATATRATGVAAGIASRALGLLGGPIGVITTLLGLGVSAWVAWGSASENAQAQASEAVEESTAQILANLEKQNAKLRERIELGKQLGIAVGREPTQAESRLGQIGTQISDLQAGRGINGGAALPEAARVALMQTLLKQYAELDSQIKQNQSLDAEAKGLSASKQAAEDLIAVRNRLRGVNAQYLEDLKKYQAALASGAITEQDYIREVSDLANKAFRSSEAGKAASEVASGASKVDSAYKSLISTINQKIEAEKNAADAYQKYISGLSKDNAGIREQITQLDEQTQRLGLTELAVARLDAAKLEMLATDAQARASGLEENEQNAEAIRLLTEQAQAYRDLADAKIGNAGRRETLRLEDESEKAAQKAIDDWEKASQKINDSLTDALLRGFESGKDFAKNLRDTVVNMFKTLVLRPIISAVINPIGGAVAGALGFGGGSAQAAGVEGGGLGGIGGIASTLSQGLNLLNGGISSSITSAFSRFATSSIGQSLGLGTAPVIGNNPSAFVPSQVTPLGSSVGSAVGAAGGFLAGRGLGQAISGGYAVSGSGNGIVNVGAALGAFFGPIGSVIGGAIAGLVNRLFGRKLKDFGVEGTLGGEAGFEGRQFEFYKGGLFASDKTKYSELDAEFEKGIANIFKSMRAQVGFFADALGLDTSRIEEFTSSIKISTKGLEPQEIQARFQEAIATANNELAEQLIGSYEETVTEVTRRVSERVGDPDNYDIVFRDITETEVTRTYKPSEFAREGEQAIDTLTRLATSLLTVNGIFESLGQTLLESSLAGGDIASQLADLFGGLDNFTSAASGYLSAYYTGEEQRALALAQIGSRLAEVGLTTPTSKEDLRRQLEAQDLTTEAGRRAYAALLEVAAAFAQVEDSAQAAADAAAEAAEQAYNNRVSAAFAALERATDKERQIIQSRIDVANESIEALTGVFDAITDGIKGLREDALGAVVAGQAGQNFITNALANAQSTGYLPDAGELQQAISDARAGLSEQQFVSESDRRFEQLRLAGELAALGDLTENQLTEAQRLLATSEAQLDALDKQLEYWREQIEIAQGTFEAAISIEEAISNLVIALMPDVTANTNPTVKPPEFVIGGGNTEPSSNVIRSAGRDANGRYITEQYYGGYGSGFTVVNDAEQERLEELQRVYEEASNTAENIADAFRI